MANSYKLPVTITPSLLVVILILFLSSCASKDQTGYYKIGKPYQIQGLWYKPKEQYNYDEIGMASWYGTDFHNKKTANGGTFDKNSLTAAHRTLPLPSMVRVTNLENNKSVMVMVNDRGPFSKKRILDVSEKAAEKLGFKNKGTAKVRVKFLPEETKKLLANVPGAKDIKIASNPDTAITDDNTNARQTSESKESTSSSFSPLISSANAAEPAIVQNGHYIQAGTFSVLDNAKHAETKLSSLGNVNVIPVTINSRQMYKVKIGPLTDKQSSKDTLNKIKSLGFTDAIMTNK